ncbi:sensor histidine kinase [Lentzea sp. NEAU-D7]|uniref:sensor histidine kinase n=1 Tax=Lentzea sp. NEAU-D7 TaxID=2994667 RepID=UPI00224B7C20|nr:histidine kinase [Lentzea sp. NEAU-D7]MCX2955318.1 histidine kinase [Lentzea sp. NEAU-D7]
MPGWPRMEPDGERPPVRVWRDWVLVAGVAGTAVAEVVVRDDMVWRPAGVVFGVTLALTMLWRRVRPLVALGVGFGGLMVADLAAFFVGGQPFSPYAGMFVVVLVYSLFRWGTGRQTAIGLAVVLLEWLVAVTTDFPGVVDAGGGLVVLLFPAALGVLVRSQHIVHTQRFERIRFQEREMLARELHDTVAHHVSAIAIQAQAGRFLAGSRDLDGAARALEVIEGEASRTLTEMRSMVGSLRRGTGAPEVFAHRGMADIEDLATAEGDRGLRIDVERCGDLHDLRPSVEAALYRVAQESITNAKRHARHATRVRVLVDGGTDTVRLSVSDDGERALSNSRVPGYGLVGMAERVTLLGGTLEAGPGPDHGWTVHAVIPRREALA